MCADKSSISELKDNLVGYENYSKLPAGHVYSNEYTTQWSQSSNSYHQPCLNEYNGLHNELDYSNTVNAYDWSMPSQSYVGQSYLSYQPYEVGSLNQTTTQKYSNNFQYGENVGYQGSHQDSVNLHYQNNGYQNYYSNPAESSNFIYYDKGSTNETIAYESNFDYTKTNYDQSKVVFHQQNLETRLPQCQKDLTNVNLSIKYTYEIKNESVTSQPLISSGAQRLEVHHSAANIKTTHQLAHKNLINLKQTKAKSTGNSVQSPSLLSSASLSSSCLSSEEEDTEDDDEDQDEEAHCQNKPVTKKGKNSTWLQGCITFFFVQSN